MVCSVKWNVRGEAEDEAREEAGLETKALDSVLKLIGSF